jgi:hypothetical protein
MVTVVDDQVAIALYYKVMRTFAKRACGPEGIGGHVVVGNVEHEVSIVLHDQMIGTVLRRESFFPLE